MNIEAVEVFEYKGYKIKVYIDEDPLNPRTEWDNFGTMVCLHKRYNLGDVYDMSLEDAQELEASPDVVSLPIYMYDHSGITISTGPFNSHWDSGKLGFIYVTKDNIRKEYSCNRISKQTMKKVTDLLMSKVKTYDNYITGQVYGFQVEGTDGEELDSCWGFFGDYDSYLLDEAKSSVDCHIRTLADKENARRDEIARMEVPGIYLVAV